MLKKWWGIILIALEVAGCLLWSPIRMENYFFVWMLIAFVLLIGRWINLSKKGIPYDDRGDVTSCIGGSENIRMYAQTRRHQRIDEMKASPRGRAYNAILFFLFNVVAFLISII